MRIVVVCSVLLVIGVLVLSSSDVGGDPAPLVLTARIVRGAAEDLPALEQGKVRVLEEQELAEFLRAFDAVPGGESVARVTTGLQSGGAHEFSVTDLERVFYVADYDITPGSSEVPRPIRRTIREGTILEVKATAPPEGGFVTFDFRVTCASLMRPIPTFSTSIGGGPPLTIELPELSVKRTKESVTVPVGRWAAYRAAADKLILLGAETAPAKNTESELAPGHRPR